MIDTNNSKYSEGFTLFEIAVVLVIIGLIAGGFLLGRDMIRSAELRGVVSEFKVYTESLNLFRVKYNGLPGDLSNATDFWGAAHPDPAACLTASSTGTLTCNGNGDMYLDTHPANTPGARSEEFAAWKHLENAGFITGNYSGFSGGASYRDAIINVNVPRSAFDGAGWTAMHIDDSGATGVNFTIKGDYGSVLAFGSEYNDWETAGKVLTPAEMRSLDVKVDDGSPAYGNVISRFWNNACSTAANGVTGTTNRDARYRIEDNTPQCSFFVLNQF